MHMHVAELHMLCRSAYARRRRSHRRRRRRRHAGNALCYVDADSDVALRSCCCCVGERQREYACESTKCMCMCECSSSSSRARTSQQTHTHTHMQTGAHTLPYFCLSALPCCAAAVDVGWRRRVVARKNIFNEPTESTACNSSNQFELKREAVNMF